MVHGICGSVGCFAMADYIDDLYTIASASSAGGQSAIEFHSFPFPMTRGNIDLASRAFPQLRAYWNEIEPGWRLFEESKRVPTVVVRNGAYAFEPAGVLLVSGSHNDRSSEPVRFFNHMWDFNGLQANPPKVYVFSPLLRAFGLLTF